MAVEMRMRFRRSTPPSDAPAEPTCKTCNGAGGEEVPTSSTNYVWRRCQDCNPTPEIQYDPDTVAFKPTCKDGLLGAEATMEVVLSVKDDALTVFTGSCNSTIDAIEYMASALIAKYTQTQKESK
jgi:hypothetical protein